VRATTAHRSVHVGADDVVDCRARCPICGSDERRKRIAPLQRDPDIDFLACRRCHGTSASHMPTAGFLQRYYAGYHDGRSARVTFGDSLRFARHVVSSLPEMRGSVRILDFGGGDGTLAIAIARRLLEGRATNIDITVVDWSEAVADAGDPRIRVDACRTIDDVAGDFDLVLASAVLEHVPDLRTLLPALVARVARRGVLYVRTPYVVPLRRLLPVDVGFPAHVHDLGSDFWHALDTWLPSPLRTIVSRPSPVAASWRHDPLRALVSHVLKVPGRVSRSWPFVGGWEAVLERPA